MVNGSCFLFYVDPGSGALLWQLLIAFFFGAAFYARSFWSRIFGFRSRSSQACEQKSEEIRHGGEERW
ncbi:MAG: hypothetical protein C4334_09975 [Pyrinomonas sp.]